VLKEHLIRRKNLTQYIFGILRLVGDSHSRLPISFAKNAINFGQHLVSKLLPKSNGILTAHNIQGGPKN